MARAVELAALVGVDAVDDALGLAAMAGRFADGDLASILDHLAAGHASLDVVHRRRDPLRPARHRGMEGPRTMSATPPSPCDGADAVELAELLEFLNDWLHHRRRRRQLPALHLRAAHRSTSCAPTWPASRSSSAATATTSIDGRRVVKPPTPPPIPDELTAVLRRMRLPYMRAAAPDVLATARSQRWDPAEVLRVLLEEEAAGRDAATRRQRRKAAGFPAGKTFESWRPEDSSIPAPTQSALRTLEWVGPGREPGHRRTIGHRQEPLRRSPRPRRHRRRHARRLVQPRITHHRRRPRQGRRLDQPE